MKVYIAGPMTGLPDFNYPVFERARRDLARRGHKSLCPTDSEADNRTGKPQTWEWYMRRALRMVSKADGIALLPGWQNSRGAQLEVHVGRELGLPVVEIEEWL